MKKQILLLAAVFATALFTPICAQTEPGLTLVTNLSSKGASQILLHFEGKVEVAFWDEEYLQLEIQLEQSNLTRQQQKSLVSTGFFKVKALGGHAGIALSMPSQSVPVFFNGMKADNKLAFKVTVPRHAEVIRPEKGKDLLAKN